MKRRSQHIPFRTLAEMAEDGLAGEERAAAQSHVADCSRCASQLERLVKTVDLMRTDTAEDAPPEVIARAVNLFRLRSPAEPRPSLVRRVLAALSFDSLQLAPAYGVRSGSTAARQLIYNAGENDLDLRLTSKDESWIVSGQVLGQGCTGGEALLQGSSGQAIATLNELCEFALPPVASGSYTLHVRFNDVEVEVPDLELRA
ncbi:MAG TPA: hypothetical protein VF544_20115 [Pyrinomonadaceae bacterium]|jgi:hypothetical protein